MDVKIYQGVSFKPDQQVGWIDERGKIYAVGSGADEYVGWIDYQEGNIYDEEGELAGWVEDDGAVVYSEDDGEEIEIGYVTEEGELFGYNDEEQEVYLGKIKNMSDVAEGAAAILFLFDEE